MEHVRDKTSPSSPATRTDRYRDAVVSSLHQVFVPFGATLPWIIVIAIANSLFPNFNWDGFLSFIGPRGIYLFKLLALLSGLLPFFALPWIVGWPEGGRLATLGKSACLPVFRVYGWAFTLPELIRWRHASWLGESLSWAIALPIMICIYGPMIYDLIIGWPMSGILAVTLIILGLVTLFNNMVSDKLALILGAVRSTLIPSAVGFSGVFLMQILINAFEVDSENIRLFENRMAYVSAEAKDWVSFSIPASIAMASGIIILILIAPGLHAGSRFLSLKRFASTTAACLTAFSSFTFFSQIPFKYADSKEAKRIQAEKRSEDSQSRQIALADAYLIVENLSAREACDYRGMFEQLDEREPYPEHGKGIEGLSEYWVSVGNGGGGQRSFVVKTLPDGFLSASVGARKGQSLAVIQDLFSVMIGASSPEVKGMAGKFIEEFVSQESDRLFKSKIEPTLDRDIDKIGMDSAAQTLATLNSLTQRSDEKPSDSSADDGIRKELGVVEREIISKRPVEPIGPTPPDEEGAPE